MANWRTRNFVPDSDDEDSEEASQLSNQHDDSHRNDRDGLAPSASKAQLEEKKAADTIRHSSLTQSNNEGSPQAWGTGATQEPALNTIKASKEAVKEEESEDELALPTSKIRSKPQVKAFLRRLFNPVLQRPRNEYDSTIQGEAQEHQENTTPTPPEIVETIDEQDDDAAEHGLSSALSSLTSSPQALSPQVQTVGPGTTAFSDLLSRSQPLKNLSGRIREPSARPVRTFRQRKAIQLNPYAIEGQRYRDTLKARGLRPVQVEREVEKDVEKDTSVSAPSSDDEEPPPQKDTRNTPPSQSHEQSFAVYDFPSSPPDEDFPGIDTSTRPPMPGSVNKGFKRRKTNHTYSKKGTSTHDLHLAPQTTEDGWIPVPGLGPNLHLRTSFIDPSRVLKPTSSPLEEPVRSLAASRRTRDEPFQDSSLPPLPSPAMTDTPAMNSPSPSMKPTKKITEPTRGVTPPQLQTPATSSEHRPFGLPRAAVLTGNKAHTINDVLSISSQRFSSSDDDSPSESEAYRQVTLAQRRTRGVLPASWHRLEFNKQRGKQPDSSTLGRQANLSSAVETRKGVARVISTWNTHNDYRKVGQPLPILIDDDPDSDSQNLKSSSKTLESVPAHQQSDFNDVMIYDDEDDENMEDNAIEMMAASSSRRRSSNVHKKVRTRQPKITEILSNKKKVRVQTGSKGLGTHKCKEKAPSRNSKPRTSKPRSSKSNKRKSQLSILDVTQNMKRAETPNFLLIANRTAKRRSNKGRHSPSRKVLQMQTEEETAEVQDSVRRWKSGRLKPSQAVRPNTDRLPLSERTLNSLSSDKFLASSDDDGYGRPSLSGQIDSLRQMKDQRSDSSALKASTLNSRPRFKVPQSLNAITSNLRSTRLLASAQLETDRRPSQHGHRQLGEPSMLNRFLEAPTFENTSTALPHARKQLQPNTSRRRQPRKRLPRQQSLAPSVEVDEVPIGNYDSPVDLTHINRETSSQPWISLSGLISGLEPFGTEYSSTLNFEHLPDGQHFDVGTLLGAGIFERALSTLDLERHLVSLHANVGLSFVEWGPWNEVVSDQIREAILRVVDYTGTENLASSCIEEDSAESLTGIDTILRYINGHLRFLDPSDRHSFVQRMQSLLSSFVDSFESALGSTRSPETHNYLNQTSARFLILSHQIRQLSDHVSIPSEVKSQVDSTFSTILTQTLRSICSEGLEDFVRFSRDVVNLSGHPSRKRIRNKVEAFVISLHLLSKETGSKIRIWDELIDLKCLGLPPDSQNVRALDRVWKQLMSLIPLFEISSRGTVKNDNTDAPLQANWKLVKQLMQPVLHAHQTNPSRQGPTFNEYCRAIFARCLHLIRYWRWYDCEPILGLLFDFFAHNDLNNLHLEEVHGSPHFLEELKHHSSLHIERRDRCFHVFLKIIGAGLRALRSVPGTKKIGNFVWRLTPNHDRQLPKDKQTRQEDLDAVRNHLDLLSTLYWAAPAGNRLRLDAVRRIIDIEDSHEKACHLVIKTWSNLVNFQLSTDESPDALVPFMQWFDEIIDKTIKLHQLARSEVEMDAISAEATHGQIVSRDIREKTIAQSQRHIESIIEDALNALRRAIMRATNASALLQLMTPNLGRVFELFDVQHPRINHVIISALEVLQAFTVQAEVYDEGDDSQGFGDWSAFQELAPGVGCTSPITVSENLNKGLHRLLSNAFGADASAEDTLLMSIVKCWLALAKLEIKAGNKTWRDLIDPYGQESWNAIRNTEQTRRFTPFLLAALIDSDPAVYSQNRFAVIQEWLVASVERESLIKYQPLLTASLLNQNTPESLLENPPFWKNSQIEKFEISIADFCERRLSLLSCFLSNVRESVSFMAYHSMRDRQSHQREYTEMLKRLMSAMKSNYQTLGQGSDIQGAYVSFVQHIVALLQEHTADICKIDPFFTDAINFPLPANDPEYIVGHLKSLELRLLQPGGAQKFSAFLQTLCERAAIQDEQDYFASLLSMAMENAFEDGTGGKMTLRSFTVRVLFPAYMDITSRMPCGWVVATPLLVALSPLLESLVFHMDGFKSSSVDAVLSLLSTLLVSIHRSTRYLTQHSDFDDARIFRILTLCLTMISSSLEPLDYILRCLTTSSTAGTELLGYLKGFTLIVQSAATDIVQTREPDRLSEEAFPRDQLDPALQVVQKFAADQLHDAFSPTSRRCKWKCENGEYLVQRNGRWEGVPFSLCDLELERQQFTVQAKRFLKKLNVMPTFSGLAGDMEAGRWAGDVVAANGLII